ncbi:MAG: RnfABCDGE type electron transport complex subunit D, partial [Spirochaetaceae bacterium]|nr:RnfABCDGE type electron transport complex subunit D [Spirochaetaceae bacterium]
MMTPDEMKKNTAARAAETVTPETMAQTIEQEKAAKSSAAHPMAVEKLLWLQSSPHIARPETTPVLMTRVLVALTPAAVFGVVIFGISALLNIAVAVASAIIGEALFRRVTKQDIRLKDLSACVTGLLLALVIPPSTPLWMTALG